MVLFDGPHTYTRVAGYAFLTGLLCGGGVVAAVLVPSHVELGLFAAALGAFHWLEYVQTSLWNPQHLSLDSFLLNHSNEYHGALVLGLCEYTLELVLVPTWKTVGGIKALGVSLMVVGLLLRNLALYTARSNFNHLVQTTKAPSHRLVTHGVYAWTRHPSYAGFFWYSLGTQVLLANPLTLVVYVGALYAFFIPRIQYPPLAAHPPWHACFTGRSPLTTRALGLVGGGTEEEAYLVEFFGDAYRAFQRTVPTLIPFVK